MNRLQPARLGSDPEQGRDLDLLGRRLSRHRHATKARRSSSRTATRRAGSGTSRSTTTSSASASWRRSTTCSRAARTTRRPTRRKSSCARASRSASPTRRRVTGYFATKDYSYRSTQVAGDGWVLVGDAFGFLDPLYSSGVLLALKSGELAADAIVEGLAKGDTSAAQLGQVGPRLQRGRGPHAPPGLRVLRRLQLRQDGPAVSRSCAAR